MCFLTNVYVFFVFHTYLVYFPRRNNDGQGGAGRGSHFSRAGQGGAGISDAELSKNFLCLLTLSVARLLEDRFRWNCEKFGRKIEGCWPAERTLRLAATFGRLVIGIAPTLLSVKERKVIWARVTIFLQFYQYFPGFRFKWTSFRIECTSVCSLSRSWFNASSHSTWTRFGIELDTATKGGRQKACHRLW